MKVKKSDFIKRACLALLFASLTVVSCREEEVPILNEQQELILEYFKEIALGFEFSNDTPVTRKWKTPMKLYVGGVKDDPYLLETLTWVVNEINVLATDGFQVSITQDQSVSNAYIYFGSVNDFLALFPEESGVLTNGDFGLSSVWYNYRNFITQARIFVEVNLSTKEQQKSIILEEVTQSLGLGNDSPLYPSSIFYETATDGGYATQYSEMDKELVRLLYHPDMKQGLDIDEVDLVLRRILGAGN